MEQFKDIKSMLDSKSEIKRKKIIVLLYNCPLIAGAVLD
jgi:hypothetical protein